MEFISLIFCILCAVICYNIAKNNHWNTILAAIVGFIFPLISVIAYGVCPECGTKHDRDINTAMNILLEGQRMLTTA